jgi:hypothetical protein
MNGMTCREFDEVVHSFVRMELLDVNLREEALDHAARCAICAERMGEAGVLAEATEAAGKSLHELQTPPTVEATVMAAFRRHHRHVASRRMFGWAAVGAAAALSLVFLWTTMGPSSGPSAPSPRKDVSSRSSQPMDAQGPAATTQQSDLTQDADVQIADASTLATTYAASDFVPVTFAEGISPEDPGMIVRVQLTRASLAELGYPLADAPDEDLIPADVLVGEDGWPRAVRLVQ